MHTCHCSGIWRRPSLPSCNHLRGGLSGCHGVIICLLTGFAVDAVAVEAVAVDCRNDWHTITDHVLLGILSSVRSTTSRSMCGGVMPTFVVTEMNFVKSTTRGLMSAAGITSGNARLENCPWAPSQASLSHAHMYFGYTSAELEEQAKRSELTCS